MNRKREIHLHNVVHQKKGMRVEGEETRWPNRHKEQKEPTFRKKSFFAFILKLQNRTLIFE